MFRRNARELPGEFGRIDGTAYRDHDGNGLMENEEALAGMTLKLIPSRNELEEITVQTGTDGSFILDDLRPEDRNIGEVIIAKQRSGPLGTVKLAWLSEITTFANLAKEPGPSGDAPF